MFESTFPFPLAPKNVFEARITQKSFIKLETTDQIQMDLKELRKYVSRINNFLCLAINQPVALTNLVIYSSDSLEKTEEKSSSTPIQMYYESLPHPNSPPKIYKDKMLFEYGAIASTLDTILATWLENYEELESVFNLYFLATTDKITYPEIRFLFLVMGLESLHRRTNDEPPIPEDEYEETKSLLIEACPKNRREWLTKTLEYANQLTLSTRIRRLIKPFKKYFGNSDKREDLIGDIFSTRNYLTHRNEKLKDEAKSGMELWKLCKEVETLFTLQLLSRLAFSDEQIDKIIMPHL